MNRTAAKVQIVIAHLEQSVEAVPDALTTTRGDGLNAVAKLRDITIAKACMWLRKGSVADVAKAEAFAATINGRVFTFSTSERNPLEAAKSALLGAR